MKEGTLFPPSWKVWGKAGSAHWMPVFPLPPCALSSPFPRRHTAPTSAHSSHQAGLGTGPLMSSSPCSEKAPVGGTPSPQREGHHMAASRQVTPLLGVPAPSSLPGVAGSQNGNRLVGHPPPQCPGGSRRLGESPVWKGATKGRDGGLQRDTGSLPECC